MVRMMMMTLKSQVTGGLIEGFELVIRRWREIRCAGSQSRFVAAILICIGFIANFSARLTQIAFAFVSVLVGYSKFVFNFEFNFYFYLCWLTIQDLYFFQNCIYIFIFICAGWKFKICSRKIICIMCLCWLATKIYSTSAVIHICQSKFAIESISMIGVQIIAIGVKCHSCGNWITEWAKKDFRNV